MKIKVLCSNKEMEKVEKIRQTFDNAMKNLSEFADGMITIEHDVESEMKPETKKVCEEFDERLGELISDTFAFIDDKEECRKVRLVYSEYNLARIIDETLN